MPFKTFILFSIFAGASCNTNNAYTIKAENEAAGLAAADIIKNNPYASINEIPLPAGFERIKKDTASFGNWLLKVKLKKDKTVFTFNGRPKANQNAQFAVLDISVGEKDLQQCADAVMRLRAEYLFATKQYRQILFRDNEGKVYQFEEPYTSNNLQQYLQRVFGMCGSASLAKQLKHAALKEMEPGDVIIRGGFPGHAVIVMDVAINPEGKKIYLLAQSYMPAQDIHILVNPLNKNFSPWYTVNDEALIQTPEYTFTREELRKW